MRILLPQTSLEQAQKFPRTKWGIPEPSKAEAAGLEDATEASDLSLLLVPAVAFDARCGRLGHGRGYYDAFIARQRALVRAAGSPRVTVVGLALREQMVECVPMEECVLSGLDAATAAHRRAFWDGPTAVALTAHWSRGRALRR